MSLYVVVSEGVFASKPFGTVAEADDFREILIANHGCHRWNTHVEVFDNPEEALDDMRYEMDELRCQMDELEQENAALRKELDEWRMGANK